MSGQSFLLVACPLPPEQTKDTVFSLLKSRISGKNLCDEGFPPVKFDVPDGEGSLKFGSFDNLIKLMDDLVRYDGQLEQVLRRMERQAIEMAQSEPPQFVVVSQSQPYAWDKYVRGFKWDEAKFPKGRPMQDLLNTLSSSITREDDEVRSKTVMYNELKSQINAITKREGLPLTGVELADILTPEVVKDEVGEASDFIYSEHLTTVVCIVPRYGEKVFLDSYESVAKVVPMSARQFKNIYPAPADPHADKDGNTVWRVVVLKSDAEKFKKASKEFCMPRDFEYNKEQYQQMMESRNQKTEDLKKQSKHLKKITMATFSDTLVAMMHVKAMRVFVESVLRFGLPPRFAAFMIKTLPSAVPQLRSALANFDVFSRSTQFGAAYSQSKGADDEGTEEYWPYVSLGFTPLILSS